MKAAGPAAGSPTLGAVDEQAESEERLGMSGGERLAGRRIAR